MSDGAISRRYASALFAEADAEGQVDRVDEDVEFILAGLDVSNDLRLFFASPVISRVKKNASVRRLFGEAVSYVTRRLLLLLNNKGRDALCRPAAKFRTS